MRALVVFHDAGNHVLSRFLKEGFRHCFVVIKNGDYWIMIDGLKGVPLVEVVAKSDYDLAAHCRNDGATVVETEQRAVAPRAPYVNSNCVGLVKSVLGVRSIAVTPYGLYKHLRRES